MQTAMMVVNTLKELNIISISFRIVLAVICGGVIGAERGRAHQSLPGSNILELPDCTIIKPLALRLISLPGTIFG